MTGSSARKLLSEQSPYTVRIVNVHQIDQHLAVLRFVHEGCHFVDTFNVPSQEIMHTLLGVQAGKLVDAKLVADGIADTDQHPSVESALTAHA